MNDVALQVGEEAVINYVKINRLQTIRSNINRVCCVCGWNQL